MNAISHEISDISISSLIMQNPVQGHRGRNSIAGTDVFPGSAVFWDQKVGVRAPTY